jgi:Helix-turn-helix domain
MSDAINAAGDGWLNTKQAAAYLGCSKQWLDKMRHMQEGPVYHKPGRIMYARADLDAWVRKSRVKPTGRRAS